MYHKNEQQWDYIITSSQNNIGASIFFLVYNRNMKKKWIIIFAISLPILVFLITFTLFELSKRYFANKIDCLDQRTLNIPSEISPLTQDLCLVEYSTAKNSIHMEFSLNNDFESKLATEEWTQSDSDTYKKGKYSLNLSGTVISIVEETTEVGAIKENDTSIPELVHTAEVIRQGYQVTSKEISRINTTNKVVVFTFDGGSGIQSMDLILSTLAKYNLTSTFFLTGKWAEANVNDVKRINNSGHEIFNHSYSHPDFATITDTQIAEEFSKTETIISNITDKSTKPFFRPPYGSRNTHIREYAASLGYQDVYWTIDALDWKESTGTTAETVKSRILDKLAPGNIYLMHIGDNLTGQVLDEVIQEILNRGYSIMSLYEAISMYP